MTRRAMVAAILAGALAVGGPAAAAGRHVERWGHYFDRRSGNTVAIRSRCIRAEDSAAHLRLIAYADGGGRIVLGCARRGY